jgi:hypothetical protein
MDKLLEGVVGNNQAFLESIMMFKLPLQLFMPNKPKITWWLVSSDMRFLPVVTLKHRFQHLLLKIHLSSCYI